MRSSYEYMKQVQYLDSFSVEDVGNCIIISNNDENTKNYLMIRTVLGVSRILQVGPIEDGAITRCGCYFQQIDYDDAKLDKIIEKFVDSKADMTQVEVIDSPEKEDYISITDSLPDMRLFLYD